VGVVEDVTDTVSGRLGHTGAVLSPHASPSATALDNTANPRMRFIAPNLEYRPSQFKLLTLFSRSRFGFRVQLPKRRRQLRHLMIRIEPARLRQQPQPRWPNPLGLRPDHRFRPPKRRAIRTDPYHRHPLGFIARRLGGRKR